MTTRFDDLATECQRELSERRHVEEFVSKHVSTQDEATRGCLKRIMQFYKVGVVWTERGEVAVLCKQCSELVISTPTTAATPHRCTSAAQ